MKIMAGDAIGFTKSPDGRHYVNIKGFRQVEVTAIVWRSLKKVCKQ